jgi:hypothetical protein
VNFFPVLLASPELDARAAFCPGTIHPGTHQIVGAVQNMRAKFLFHFSVHLGAMEQVGKAEAKRIEDFHSSSSG